MPADRNPGTIPTCHFGVGHIPGSRHFREATPLSSHLLTAITRPDAGRWSASRTVREHYGMYSPEPAGSVAANALAALRKSAHPGAIAAMKESYDAEDIDRALAALAGWITGMGQARGEASRGVWCLLAGPGGFPDLRRIVSKCHHALRDRCFRLPTLRRAKFGLRYRVDRQRACVMVIGSSEVLGLGSAERGARYCGPS